MLITLKDILQIAEEKKCAIGSFNTPNLESIIAVLNAAEALGEPVIIMHAEVHETMTPLAIIGPIMLDMAKKAKVPVCVHLDHGVSLDYLQQALNIGFTSIMYDGSALEYEENLANTRRAVAMAAATGASVEAEIGVVGRPETALGDNNKDVEQLEDSDMYTNPDIAKEFIAATGIDAFACAFGTAHGIYTKEPKLDFPRVAKIKSLINIPIVMHGGSGVSKEDFYKAIASGVRKINYYTYMAKAGGQGVKDNINDCEIVFYHDIIAWGIKAMEENALSAIKMFSGKEVK